MEISGEKCMRTDFILLQETCRLCVCVTWQEEQNTVAVVYTYSNNTADIQYVHIC